MDSAWVHEDLVYPVLKVVLFIREENMWRMFLPKFIWSACGRIRAGRSLKNGNIRVEAEKYFLRVFICLAEGVWRESEAALF